MSRCSAARNGAKCACSRYPRFSHRTIFQHSTRRAFSTSIADVRGRTVRPQAGRTTRSDFLPPPVLLGGPESLGGCREGRCAAMCAQDPVGRCSMNGGQTVRWAVWGPRTRTEPGTSALRRSGSDPGGAAARRKAWSHMTRADREASVGSSKRRLSYFCFPSIIRLSLAADSSRPPPPRLPPRERLCPAGATEEASERRRASRTPSS